MVEPSAAVADVHENRDGRVLRARLRRESTRVALVKAAAEVFALSGYLAASPEAVARKAGVTRATFYLHFDSKAEAFHAVLDAQLERLRAVVQGVELGEGAASPQAQLSANLLRVLDVLLEDRDLARLLLVEAPGKDAALDARLARFHGHVRGLIREALVDGAAVGLVRPLDSELAAHALLGAVHGVMVGRLVQDSRPMSREERFGVARELLRICLGGVAAETLRLEVLRAG
jgi:AcrR family transcriptional regulator